MSRINFVKEALESNKLTYTWLLDQLDRRGIKVRPADLSGIYGDKAETIIETAMDIVTDYLKEYG